MEFKIKWGLIIKNLACEETDFKFDSRFNREPKKKRRNMLFQVPLSTLSAAF